MTRLSDAELEWALRQADRVCEMHDKNLYTYKVLEKGDDYVRFARALRQLRDDLDAVTRERDFGMRHNVEIYQTVESPDVWRCTLLDEDEDFDGLTPLEALRKAMAAHAPTPEGSK